MRNYINKVILALKQILANQPSTKLKVLDSTQKAQILFEMNFYVLIIRNPQLSLLLVLFNIISLEWSI